MEESQRRTLSFASSATVSDYRTVKAVAGFALPLCTIRISSTPSDRLATSSRIASDRALRPSKPSGGTEAQTKALRVIVLQGKAK